MRLENLEIAKFSQSKEKWKEQVIKTVSRKFRMNFPVNCGTKVKKAFQLLILVLIPRWRSNRRAGEK